MHVAIFSIKREQSDNKERSYAFSYNVSTLNSF